VDGALLKSWEVTDLPVRAAAFVPRRQWVVTGADDCHIRVFNVHTLARERAWEAHADYIRAVAPHPTLPLLLSASDDMTVKAWDWERGWACTQVRGWKGEEVERKRGGSFFFFSTPRALLACSLSSTPPVLLLTRPPPLSPFSLFFSKVFEGHSHYVMALAVNPKDPNTFATASLDRTVKVWSLGSPVPNFTLEGHAKGVNAVAYCPGGDRPYLISGADDRTARVWDYQTKATVTVLEGHAHNVSAVAFHPELPLIVTGSEDGAARLWHATTYRLEVREEHRKGEGTGGVGEGRWGERREERGGCARGPPFSSSPSHFFFPSSLSLLSLLGLPLLRPGTPVGGRRRARQ
jgi:coatomer subunit beta'